MNPPVAGYLPMLPIAIFFKDWRNTNFVFGDYVGNMEVL